MKPITEQQMKIDMAPWMEAYTVNMNDLYTELTLKKLENKPTGTESSVIAGYQELFQDKDTDSDSVTIEMNNDKGALSTGNDENGIITVFTKVVWGWGKGVFAVFASLFFTFAQFFGYGAEKENIQPKRKIKRVKVLCKGDPGMGKTTLMKKVGWDWARELFTTYSIVFFVFLKLVQPSDAIENIIIQQTPEVEGMGVTAHKLKQILETFGDRCLLILDGLDEHAIGKNKDTLRIIKSQKLLNCNIIVTSRPHSTSKIERYFPTIISVQGFTYDRARAFAFNVLGDRGKAKLEVNFRPSFDEYIYQCPILLLIICLLVKHDSFNLEDDTFEKGYLYFRLTRFLYKKYTIQQNMYFEQKKFISVLTKLGKLAWETLLYGNSNLKHSQVINELGEDVFKYGILIGHEDFRLIGKEATDIIVTFPHRTIQDFLGSFYFLLKLTEGEKIKNLVNMNDRNTIRFMVDPLFLHFCLWFLFSDQKEMSLSN